MRHVFVETNWLVGFAAPKEPLLSVYDQAAIWVYQDFLLQEPQMPANWPAAES